jgi:uncharacterized protein YecT (DUF1311 family)
MKTKMVLAMIAFASLCVEASQSICTNKITKELEACAKDNFDYSDKILNISYKKLAIKLSAGDSETLVRAEKEWVAYKDTTYDGAFSATSPGEEAGIDKWTCLDQITRARIEEIQYLNSGIGALGFYKALDVIPKLYEDKSRIQFIEKLVEKYGEDENESWSAYVDENCKLAVSRLHEEKSDCIARQSFYRY